IVDIRSDHMSQRLGWIASFGIDGEPGPSRIVAVEPKAAIEIQLSAGPGAKNHAELGAKDRVGCVARIDGDVTLDIKDEDIFPQTKDGTHLGEPLRLVLIIEANAGFVDVVIRR